MPTANTVDGPVFPTTALDRTPEFTNFLSPLHATFLIKKLPGVNFTVQGANIPRLTLPNVTQANPFVNIPRMGDHIEYEPLVISFMVDEELENYIQVHNWIRSLGFPENFDEYAAISAHSKTSGLGLYSDATLMIRNSNRNVNFAINYIDAHPISLSSLDFDTRNSDVNYINAEITFVYSHFNLERV